MAKLSPNQRAKLEALWRSMPAQMRASLLASAKAAATADESAQSLVEILEDLEEALLEPAGDLAKAYLFAPMRSLTADPKTSPPSRARFNPEEISKIWGWLGRRLAKDLIPTMRKCKKPETDSVWHEYRLAAGIALEDAINSADRVPKDMTALVKRFGPNGRDMLTDAVTLLKHSECVIDSLAKVPSRIIDLDEDLCYRLKKIHEDLMEGGSAPAAVWVLRIVMGRLDSPWQIFRVVEKIGRRNDDLVISKTDLAAVGDAVLADTGFFAAQLEHPPANLSEAKEYYATFDRFVAFSMGMTKEFGIRKDGRWGQSLFGVRAEASRNVERTFDKVPLAMDSGLPEPRRGRSGRVIPAQLPPEASIERLQGLLYFIAAAREHAKDAAVASSQKRIIEAAVTRMEDAGELLVDLVAGSEGQNKNVAREGLDMTVVLLELAGRDESANLLRRRGVAAAAA